MWNTTDSTVSNKSNISGTGVLDQQYHWEVLVLLPIMLFGITGNILVCMAVSMEKRLQSVTNYFLLSLAITDLLVSVIVMPLSIVHQFFGYWPFDYIICDLYVTSDVLMCTSSILHLCTISVERYLAISSPLSVRNKSKGVVLTKIVLVWILSSMITSPITFLGFIDQKNVLNSHQCALTNEEFIIYGSIGAFFIPLSIMVTTYGLTIRLLRKQASMCGQGKDNEGQPMIRRSTSRKPIKFRQRVKFEPRRTKSCPHKNCNYPEHCRTRSVKSVGNGVEKSLPEIQITPPPSPMYTKNPEPEFDTIIEENHNGVNWRKNSLSLSTTTCSTISNDSPKRLKSLVSKHQSALKAASILLRKDKDDTSGNRSPRHDQDDVNTEQRASKVLGVVFAIFVICWAPFFVVNIMTVLCKECNFQPLLFTAFVWLGYISSTLNPIIYTMFNKTFKMTFIKLLKCQYKTIQKSLRVRWHSRNGYQSTFRTQSYYMSDNKAESQL
ncbi:5-hydroxytryptamine receptor 2A-like [Mercenaria mercenaria]|uniref:5-hydroxytryptamine receptor 2A-like n=1 Tax=Mercenaria mercenaria TaxID=6596 RepID=UPI001E1E2264|nr:5-hydroxytryptamine receptor 2A-like [Mercenaria mercenaria]XP_045200168.1 5-hydroxytryptamine receptor 2A-like [Mercenaria mercenaria]